MDAKCDALFFLRSFSLLFFLRSFSLLFLYTGQRWIQTQETDVTQVIGLAHDKQRGTK
jgi:hypothetical protein